MLWSMEAATEAAAAQCEDAALATMVSLRWPDLVRCPGCGSAEVSRRPHRRGWRCRSCRRDFTVTTGTRMHASKAPLSAWAQVAVSGSARGLSDKTARRLRRVAESTGMAPGRDRLAALLAAPFHTDAAGPLEGTSAGQRRILAVLRTRTAGATVARIAAETGLSISHVRRCLTTLRALSLVETLTTSVMWGYRHQRLKLWRLDMSERTIAALPQIGWSPPGPEPHPTTVPGEFWWLFWSGRCASELTIPEDAVHIADTLIGGPDPSARAWALGSLPLWALRQLRTMTGYDTGEASRWLDATIRQRQEARDG